MFFISALPYEVEHFLGFGLQDQQRVVLDLNFSELLRQGFVEADFFEDLTCLVEFTQSRHKIGQILRTLNNLLILIEKDEVVPTVLQIRLNLYVPSQHQISIFAEVQSQHDVALLVVAPSVADDCLLVEEVQLAELFLEELGHVAPMTLSVELWQKDVLLLPLELLLLVPQEKTDVCSYFFKAKGLFL